ncbi:MAG: hypothetical protein FJX53_08015 [Alphaproteobacteria bacterium]|nr:hypothetical protein [Alphaproteobacteria bacterium]
MRRFLVLLCFFFPPLAGAQYPNKPVKIIVPFAPGGASDFVARILQPRMGELLGQQIVIENRPGASGNISMEAAERSDPVGYTVYLGNIGTIAINTGVFPNLRVDPVKDFISITRVVDLPGVLVAHSAFPPDTFKEFFDYVKANPGKMNYAQPGSGSQNRLEMENLRKTAGGMQMVHVPYKGGAGPAVAALAAGETQG